MIEYSTTAASPTQWFQKFFGFASRLAPSMCILKIASVVWERVVSMLRGFCDTPYGKTMAGGRPAEGRSSAHNVL